MAPEQAQGPVGRQARGHLGVRRRALRDAHRPAARSTAKTSPICSPRCSARTSTWTRCRPDIPPRLRRADPALPVARSEAASARHRRRAPRCSTDPRRARRRGRGSPVASAPRHRAPPGGARCRGRVAGMGLGCGAGLCARHLGALAFDTRAHTAPPARQHRRRRVARDRPRRRGDSVAGRNDARVFRAAGEPDAPVHPQARSVAGDAARRHRGGGLPVLFAGRPVDRVLRRRQAEEGVRGWRRAGHSVRCRLRVAAGRGPTTTRSSSVPSGGANTPLLRVPADGGKPTAFGTLSQGATTQRWPQALPGGKAVLYTEHSALIGFDGANIVVAPVPADALGRRRALRKSSSPARTTVAMCQAGWPRRRAPSAKAGTSSTSSRARSSRCPSIRSASRRWARPCPRSKGSCRRRVRAARRWTYPREGTLAYVPGSASTNRRQPHRLDDARRQDVGAARGKISVGQSTVLAGRTEDRDGHLRRQAARHLGLRLGSGHADATDLRRRYTTRFPSGRPTASASCSRPTGPSPAVAATCIG